MQFYCIINSVASYMFHPHFLASDVRFLYSATEDTTLPPPLGTDILFSNTTIIYSFIY